MSGPKKLAEFQPTRLREARLTRKLSMVDLAERVGVTRQAISSYESGDHSPSADSLRKLASALGTSESFFVSAPSSWESQLQSAINFRTLKASARRSRDQAETYLKWTVGVADFSSEYVDLPAVDLPRFQIPDFAHLSEGDIEVFAEQTRRHFGLGDGPISDLTLLLENKGVLVAYVPLDAGMDGLSAWFAGRPAILVNSKAFHARARFDLAHELGHLVLHKGLSPDELDRKGVLDLVESQANKFASAFLLPAKSFLPEVYGYDLRALIALKQRWGVSIAAIAMRLHGLEVINDNQKAWIFKQLGMHGLRRKEPLDDEIATERPRMIRRVSELLDSNKVILQSEFAVRSRYPGDFVVQAMNLPETLSAAPPNNIVNFADAMALRNKPRSEP